VASEDTQETCTEGADVSPKNDRGWWAGGRRRDSWWYDNAASPSGGKPSHEDEKWDSGASEQTWSRRWPQQGSTTTAPSKGSSKWQNGGDSHKASRWNSKEKAADATWKQDWNAGHNSRKPRGGKSKQQCQFLIGIEEEPTFKVVKQILGTAGAHVKRIANATGTKLRLRGRGSKFLEGPEQEESSDPLMLCVSSPPGANYAEAVVLIKRQLEEVYREYGSFCRKNGKAVPQLRVNMNEGPREGAF